MILMSVILFLDISSGELLIIMLAVFLIFGPKKLPEIARQFGKGMNEIRRATYDIKKEIREEGRRITEETTEKKDRESQKRGAGK